MFLNDLEDTFKSNDCNGIRLDDIFTDSTLYTNIVLFVLLYADDTALFADNYDDMQNLLNIFDSYCKTWKLNVNCKKTKVLIFSGNKKDYSKVFNLGNTNLDNVEIYKYLGIIFHKSNKFTKARKHLYEQAQKAMYFTLRQGKRCHLSIQCQLKLFDSMVLPVVLYGCEIWGFESLSGIEKLYSKYLKLLLPVRKSTPLYMLYGELGRFPVDITVKVRMIGFWYRMITGKQSKLSLLVYRMLLNDYCTNFYDHKWIAFIKSILDNIGCTYIWWSQCELINSVSLLKNFISTKLTDQFLQTWYSHIDSSSKASCYRIFKSNLTFENYLTLLEKKDWYPLLRFRISNHNLPIETGRWIRKPVQDRLCSLCNSNDIGDEFHYIFICPFFSQPRLQYITKYYRSKPNIYKFHELFNCKKTGVLRKLAKFCKHIMNSFKPSGL
jgi:hypothetical protein